MSSTKARRFNRTTFQRIMLKWHARLGGIAALFLLIITLTGIVLNHQEILGIHNSEITATWVLDWYYGEVPDGENATNFRPQSLPLSRVILDLHTGKFFAISGTILVDLAAFALLLLIGSGLYNWMKRKRW
ncbi:MAG: PepSY domain-containing protein [Alphaproteobacteria bacterium]|nr:PepSY domain-containing protein [Alphaproteobacteria bacterium]